MSEYFLVTEEWIASNKTSKGGWNKKQINALGLVWPPRSGWMKLLDGTMISEEKKEAFLQAKTNKAPTKNQYQKRVIRYKLRKQAKLLKNRAG